LDQLTRAVFLEFTIYNPNVNLFGSVTLLVEFLPTGGAVTFTTINVFQLYTYLGSFGILVLVFEIVFVIYLIYLIIDEVLKMKEQKKKYLRCFWNWNDLIIIVCSILAIAFFIMKTIATAVAVNTVFASELGEFVDFQTIAYWAETYTAVFSTIVFCATLKFIKLLRFNKRIGMLSATLRHAARDLFSFGIICMIVFFAFSLFGAAVFGDKVHAYRDLTNSFCALFKFALGVFNLEELQQADYYMGSAYFMSFYTLVVMGMMTMFVSILNEAFAKAKEEIASKQNDHEIVDFMFETIKKMKNKRKSKSRAAAAAAQNKSLTALNASMVSLRVNVKEYDETEKYLSKSGDEYMQTSSFNSFNFGGHHRSQVAPLAFENDSMSLY
jgi:hypothetical protein